MPSIFLSPSTQEGNLYVTGNSEEYWMNRLADAMEPYLTASGITFTRNSPTGSAAQSIRQSNSGNYNLHLALHSNAAPPNLYGQIRGSDVYYYPSSVQGKKAADLIAQALQTIYPEPGKVRALGTTAIGEVRRPKPPRYSLSWPITTTKPTPTGSRKTSISLPAPSCWLSPSISASPSGSRTAPSPATARCP